MVERNADTKWRLNRLERHVIGTQEGDYKDGLVTWRANLDRTIARVRYVVHIWGAAILAALLATGLVDQKAAKVIGAFFHALYGQMPQ